MIIAPTFKSTALNFLSDLNENILQKSSRTELTLLTFVYKQGIVVLFS